MVPKLPDAEVLKIPRSITILLAITGVVASSIIFMYSTFATIAFVQGYVDQRHQEVLGQLSDIKASQREMNKLLLDIMKRNKP
jgi:hypothetical protein